MWLGSNTEVTPFPTLLTPSQVLDAASPAVYAAFLPNDLAPSQRLEATFPVVAAADWSPELIPYAASSTTLDCLFEEVDYWLLFY